ncbi:MAG: glycosyltransferase family 4 protein [Phycisphaerae bacterium]|nr:glycosyltransferase family 4 protein [Phycisphaerae bacterium]
MKVGVFIERVEPWRGGAETSTRELVDGLAARGCDVTVVASSPDPGWPGARYERLEVGGVLKPLRTRTFVRRAGEFLATRRFDIVHAIAPLDVCDVYQPRGGLVCETLDRNVAIRRSAARRWAKRMVHRLSLKQRSLLELERRIFRPNGPWIAAVSRYVADQVARHYPAAAPRVRVVFNGVSLDPPGSSERIAARQRVRQMHGVPDGATLMICVAHNFRLKGVGILLEAAAQALRAKALPIHVLIIGRDRDATYRVRAARLGLAGSVRFIGSVARITDYFAAADVLLHPTFYDPCSRVVLEALCCGVPCVTTRFNGAAEKIIDGTHGYVLDAPDDAAALADRMLRLMDSSLRARMADAARALAPQLHMRRHVDELLGMYDEVMANRSEPRPVYSGGGVPVR